ncbi:GNAT family N-acetyltransferase [Actinoalloteichus hymeniacidonis]|uniref:Acetyltransferase (GNAT) family protein n=1 Tax=Actinoalloteichus hymeniacidonis TaxID=340345 RepID=A0AAC9MX55_9PSEU|nr:GNAT family N-acetyltransferase [Actinoalloteichus hymeniacidonis]AOS61681.1 acetyltransferase (GNAT) family protein [Actinoalloteichus hymeniacidonis]MBB5910304.1 ribosomal protein S18 acetylase RimI-like enzyme [Actinoalloteichus hymeniacidonis]
MDYRIRLAAVADLDPAARVLAGAFETYPWTRWALPEDGYLARLEEAQRLYLAHALEHGIVLVDEPVRAVAAFLPPGAPAPTERIQQRVADLHGSRLTALTGLSLPEAPAGSWTLETVGVEVAHQGAGLGTAVISEGLALVDKRGDPIALETSDERNVSLYQRLGFTTTATTRIPDGPIVYSMNRVAC